jgi:hypothetical protein
LTWGLWWRRCRACVRFVSGTHTSPAGPILERVPPGSRVFGRGSRVVVGGSGKIDMALKKVSRDY